MMPGTPAACRANTDSGRHLVDYDDGEEEELDLAKEKFEILPGED
jgi:hypothetical protein